MSFIDQYEDAYAALQPLNEAHADERERTLDMQEAGEPMYGVDPDAVAPTVASLAPASMAVGGSPTITITGTGFVPGLSVLVDGVAYPSGRWVSATQATFVAAAAAAGTQDISVSVGGMESNSVPLTIT